MNINKITFKFEEVKNQTIQSLYKGGITEIRVVDAEYDDIYIIRLQRYNNAGSHLGGMCFLEQNSLPARPSYQADFKHTFPGLLLADVVNNIAGGTVINTK